jgi:hypothetical protein
MNTETTSKDRAPKPAPHVLIVQRDRAYAELLDQYFTKAGFRVLRCVGPHAPDYFCHLLDTAPITSPHREQWGKPRLDGCTYGCGIVEAADILVYDPWLYVRPGSADAKPLIWALRRYYPDQPLVLVWPQEGMPALDASLLADPGVHVGPSDPDELVSFVAALAGPCRHTKD